MTETLADMGEFGLIRRIRELLEKEGIVTPGVSLGIGDDAAAFRPGEGVELLVTCDCMLEGRHYLREFITPLDLGRRAMAINISDIGAMGGKPLYALLSLGLRADTAVEDIEEMYRGFMEELNPFGASIIGGNITKTDHCPFIDVTLIGEAEKDKIMRRSTARAGDVVLVTGYPGQAAAGLRMLLEGKGGKDMKDHPLVRAYNRPSHRAREGHAIGRSGLATSMIDISDGLLGDLGHICEESGVGAELFEEKLPLSSHIINMQLGPGLNIYDLVMGDSDDYELIITCSHENIDRLRSVVAGVSDVPVSEVGSIIEYPKGIRLVSKDGTKRETRPSGWDHFKIKGGQDV